MTIALIILIWVLNIGISIWNAYAVGHAWVETKHHGGWPRFMAWMGAIMSASGFSWCYLILMAFVADGVGWFSEDDLVLALNIGYVVLIPGIILSGLMITLDSWARAYRNRTVGTIGIAAWNTYAQIHNTYNAINTFGKAFGSVVETMSEGRSGKDSKGAGLILVIVLVVIALLAGVITTALIISRVAGNYELPQRRPEEEKEKELAQR
ncbi:MAG TPA: hypothetical protein VG013_31675 [Gemmataceae bacterium]|jgi:hypothetical protein|nr:hypothetical protein [Gemmataceae bacterium]